VITLPPNMSSGERAVRSRNGQLKCFCATPGRGTCANSGTSFAGPCSSLRMQLSRMTSSRALWNQAWGSAARCPGNFTRHALLEVFLLASKSAATHANSLRISLSFHPNSSLVEYLFAV